MIQFKFPLGAAFGAFVLSFLIGLISGVGLLTVLFRACILSLIVGGFVVAVKLVLKKVLFADVDDEEFVSPHVGEPHVVDIHIDDDGIDAADVGGLQLPDDELDGDGETPGAVLDELSGMDSFVAPEILVQNEEEPRDFVTEGTDSLRIPVEDGSISSEPDLMAKAIQTVLAEDSE